jgi:hypothetical protein
MLETTGTLSIGIETEFHSTFKSSSVKGSKIVLSPNSESHQLNIPLRMHFGQLSSMRCMIIAREDELGQKDSGVAAYHELFLKVLPFHSRLSPGMELPIQPKSQLVMAGEYNRGDLVPWLDRLFFLNSAKLEETISLAFYQEQTGSLVSIQGAARQATFLSNSVCDLLLIRKALAAFAKERGVGVSFSCKFEYLSVPDQLGVLGETLVSFEELERRKTLIPAIKDLNSGPIKLVCEEWEDYLANEKAIVAEAGSRAWSAEYLRAYTERVVEGCFEGREKALSQAERHRLGQALTPFDLEALAKLV